MLPAKTCCTSVCAQCVTDEQIRELRASYHFITSHERMDDGRGKGSTMLVVDLALQMPPRRGGSASEEAIKAARARCAEILNARAAKERR